jgi:hypothetical protein
MAAHEADFPRISIGFLSLTRGLTQMRSGCGLICGFAGVVRRYSDEI